MSSPFSYIIRFVALIFLQVLVLNNFQIFGFLNPKVYILFILLLPQNINKALLYLLAFALGLSIDMFENSGGIHASATLFLAFIRPLLFSMIASAGNSEIKALDLKHLGFKKFLIYISVATVLHHLWLFTLEAFTFKNYYLVLYETLISSVFSILLILIIELLFNRETK